MNSKPYDELRGRTFTDGKVKCNENKVVIHSHPLCFGVNWAWPHNTDRKYVHISMTPQRRLWIVGEWSDQCLP